MIPPFEPSTGLLPPGIHDATWEELVARFGWTPHRLSLLAGLSQKELATRLGLREQQIQRYEAKRYAGASLDRVQAVADALGVQIQERVTLPSRPTSGAEPR
jgi:transcriptional regulator with XRE-family HTH domain